MKRCLILHVGSDPALLRSRIDGLQRWNTVDCAPEEAIIRLRNNDFDLVILCHSIGTSVQAGLVGYIGTHFHTMPIVVITDLKIIQSPRIHTVTPCHFTDLKRVLQSLLEHGDAAA